MTIEEIRNVQPAFMSTNEWLREVAYQLALLNEKPSPAPIPAKQQPNQPPRR